MSTPRGFECYYFKIILNWWHSPFKGLKQPVGASPTSPHINGHFPLSTTSTYLFITNKKRNRKLKIASCSSAIFPLSNHTTFSLTEICAIVSFKDGFVKKHKWAYWKLQFFLTLIGEGLLKTMQKTTVNWYQFGPPPPQTPNSLFILNYSE